MGPPNWGELVSAPRACARGPMCNVPAVTYSGVSGPNGPLVLCSSGHVFVVLFAVLTVLSHCGAGPSGPGLGPPKPALTSAGP